MSAAEAYREIFDRIIPDSIEFFKDKTKDYEGGPAFQLLGSRGQFADINRKFWKLYQAVWEGKTLAGEQPSEIVRDFLGHCWLMLYCLEQEESAITEIGLLKQRLREDLGLEPMTFPGPLAPQEMNLIFRPVRHLPEGFQSGPCLWADWCVLANAHRDQDGSYCRDSLGRTSKERTS